MSPVAAWLQAEEFMRHVSVFIIALIACGLLLNVSLSGCGGSGGGRNGSGAGNGSEGGSDGGSGGGSGVSFIDSGLSSGSSGTTDGGVPCPAGLTCGVSCPSGRTTTISGKVFDPAGKNALYNVAVYVPATPLQPLPKGVPTGADACSCAALFKSGAITSSTTGVDGSFTLTNAPTGTGVPLVVQVGKWRHVLKINVTACQDNPQPDRSVTLPSTVAPGDTDDNMPDLAVSTGHADQLECLLLRMGVAASEYVAGAATGGHVHIFSGGDPAGGSGGQTKPGAAEIPSMPGATPSHTTLWANQDQLMPYDVTLLSCEGGETYDANPPALEAYLNAGGRVFASHFHYSWFSGPFASKQAYSAPADWGTKLATWSNPNPPSGKGPIGGIIQTTLNGSTMPFPKGVAFQQWLMGVGALGQSGVPPNELSIYAPRYNAVVTPTHTASQPWIVSDPAGMSGQTMYFSFDTPVSQNPPPSGPDAGAAPVYCGRVVFSDLHVAGNPLTNDSLPTPGGCAMTDLSPQEKALEFMLFDLSSCVIPDTIEPSGSIPQ
jgi:hypothetical protein